jgi:hypothetical protein
MYEAYLWRKLEIFSFMIAMLNNKGYNWDVLDCKKGLWRRTLHL